MSNKKPTAKRVSAKRTPTLSSATRWLVWSGIAASTALGCQGLLGIEDGTLAPGSGGTSAGGKSGTAGHAPTSGTANNGGKADGPVGGQPTVNDGGSGGGPEMSGGGDGGGPPVVPECTPSARFCSGTTVRQCADDGLASKAVESCDAEHYCDVTSATCKLGLCAPGEPACDGNRATTCNANGSAYVAGGTDCDTDETCQAGACITHLCPPSETYCSGQDVRTCSANGLNSSIKDTCVNQVCLASGGVASCQGVCQGTQTHCAANGLDLQTCDTATGQWDAGVKCTDQVCPVGKTACEGECSPGTKRCNGNGSQTCSSKGVFGAIATCGVTTASCTGAGVCGAPPSCSGLAANCGLAGNTNCCTSPQVPGGTYNRSNDPQFPATVSDFRLDNFEVTVGRFRKFVAAYSQDMIPVGAGKNLNNPSDTGWRVGYKDNLPADVAALKAANKCHDPGQTWTDTVGANENLPMVCLNWYEAQAFCIWDNARLPTEAEWNYAAAGGAEQRLYPWGATVPGMDSKLTIYDCYYGDCTMPGPVGSIPAGNAKWGQSDMAGNVTEWMADYYPTYLEPCVNCARLDVYTTPNRVVRGGRFNGNPEEVTTAYRDYDWDVYQYYTGGLRCARAK